MPNEKWAGIPYSDLSDEQREFLKNIIQDNDQNYFLTGCAGSGKTVIASHATRILKEKQQKSVKLIVYTKLLAKFIRDGFNDIRTSIDDVENFHAWRPNSNDRVDLLIVDECQDFKNEWFKKVKLFSNSQIWLGDASQQIYAEAKNSKSFNKLSQEFLTANKTELKVNYRNSISIAELAKHFITLNDFDIEIGLTLQEKINNFIKPIANNERQTSSARNQPNVFIEAQNENNEYDAIAEIVKSIQNSNEPSKQIAIVHLLHDNLDLIAKELRKRGVNFVRIPRPGIHKRITELPDFTNRALIILSPIHSLKGLEVDYIVFPRTEKIGFWEEEEINNNLMFVLFSRAKSRIYCSYVNKENSYIYKKIRNDVNNEFYEFVSSAEILGEGIPIRPDENVEQLLTDYFDELNI